jgi:hypothetical protein
MIYYAMGVKKLNKFLSEKHLIKEYSSINSYVNVHLLNNKCKSIFVAVDFWLYAHKFTYSYGNIIVGFWNQVSKLLSHRIIPIYILDGTPPAEKSTVINDRYNKKLHTENKIKDILIKKFLSWWSTWDYYKISLHLIKIYIKMKIDFPQFYMLLLLMIHPIPKYRPNVVEMNKNIQILLKTFSSKINYINNFDNELSKELYSSFFN